MSNNDPSTEISTTRSDGRLSVSEVLDQINQVQSLMKAAMRDGEHFGCIPGTGGKPTLLQPGAQKLAMMFRWAPEYTVVRRDLDGGHVEYEVKCRLTHQNTGNFVGEGVGLCSSMEAKYRYRKGGHVCPECGKDAIIKGKAEYGGGWLCFKKKNGCGAKFPDAQFEGNPDRAENEDLADTFNTILKMAKKRAFVDAVLQASSASDIFTQDLEDMRDNAAAKPAAPVPEAPPRKTLAIKTAKEPEAYKQLCETLKALGCRTGHPEECDAVLSYCYKDWTLAHCHGEVAACDSVIDKLIEIQGTGMSGTEIYREALKRAGLRMAGPTPLEKAAEEVF